MKHRFFLEENLIYFARVCLDPDTVHLATAAVFLHLVDSALLMGRNADIPKYSETVILLALCNVEQIKNRK